MKTIAIAGTFDTKGKEFLYVKKLVEELGMAPYMIHTGVFPPVFEADVTNSEIAAAAGHDIDEIVKRKDRALATEALSKGMEIFGSQIIPGRQVRRDYLIWRVRRDIPCNAGNEGAPDWGPQSDGFYHGFRECVPVCRDKRYCNGPVYCGCGGIK